MEYQKCIAMLPLRVSNYLSLLYDKVLISCVSLYLVSAESLLLSIKSLYTMSEPLSPESFSYLMPLFYCLVIKDARYAKISEKQSIELSMTVAEILLAHSSIGSHYGIPKGNYAKCLISLMASFARLHKNAREGMNIFCAAVGSVQEDPESTASDGDYSIQERAECESLVSVLLDGLLYNEEVVREACLQSLQVLQVPSGLKPPFDVRVWIAKHDESDNILAEAEKLWEDINGEKGVPKSCIEDLTELAGKEKGARE